LIAGLLAAIVSIAIVSPRFVIDDLSLVDDWASYAHSRAAVLDLIGIEDGENEGGSPTRFRPAYPVWNFLQWHTLRGSGDLTGANLWGIVRLLLFVTSVMVAALLALAPRLSVRARAAVAAVVPVSVVSTPGVATDFARFGPQEPLLVGGMVGGALLLCLGARRWICGNGRGAAVALGLGYPLWLLGVYQKEVSVCFLALAPFLYVVLDSRWRADGTVGGRLVRDRRFQLVGLAALMPVFHVLFMVCRIAAGGQKPYGEQELDGGTSFVRDAGASVAEQWVGLLTVSTPIWFAASIAGVAIAVRALKRRSAVDWLIVGLVVTAWSTLAFQGMSGAGVVSRYYIPFMTLLAVALALGVAAMPRPPSRVLVALGVVVLILGAGGSFAATSEWAATERDGIRAARLVAAYHPDRCPVYMATLEAELTHSLPLLVSRQERAASACAAYPAVVVARRTKPYPSFVAATDDRILDACRAPGWLTVGRTDHFEILACRSLSAAFTKGGRQRSVLARNRLRTTSS
jgi:hypothetical protein